MLATVVFFACCLKGAAFVAARPPTLVFLCYTRFACLLVFRNFRIASAEEETTVVFAGGRAFVVNPKSLMLLTVASY
jgi:hypothetical protein